MFSTTFRAHACLAAALSVPAGRRPAEVALAATNEQLDVTVGPSACLDLCLEEHPAFLRARLPLLLNASVVRVRETTVT